MSDILEIIKAFEQECPCGKAHRTTIKDIQIGSGLVHKTGEILKKNGFCQRLLVVADENTIRAAEGILESLREFELEYRIYDDLRVADMRNVEEIEDLIRGKEIAVLSVGTGSLNDPCRLACARQGKKLCIFATAPSMDGFASYSSPIVKNGFKSSYPAKSPEVIIGDTRILADAPVELKSAGFGDMIAKYIALMDWKISVLLTGEDYCERVAELAHSAVDELMTMADRVTVKDEYTAGKIFEALLKTGIAMSYMQNSRPASGAEHMIAHLMECKELQEGIVPNFHGEDVGVCTLEMLRYYHKMAEYPAIETDYETVDWEKVFAFYGDMAEDVKALNMPENIIDKVDPKKLKEVWPQIAKLIREEPSYEICQDAMRRAGCKMTLKDIGKTEEFYNQCLEFSPFMRKRLTLLRMKGMMKPGQK